MHAPEEVSSKVEVCLNRGCWWEGAWQATAQRRRGAGAGKVCGGNWNSAGLLKHDDPGPREVGDAGEVGGVESNSQSF